jgi:hypothetical protein
LNEIDKNKTLCDIDKDSFKKMYLNLCIYMKHAAILQDTHINFDEKVFKRIENYTRLVMNNSLFNVKGVQLQHTEFFKLNRALLEEDLANQWGTTLSNILDIFQSFEEDYGEDIIV